MQINKLLTITLFADFDKLNTDDDKLLSLCIATPNVIAILIGMMNKGSVVLYKYRGLSNRQIQRDRQKYNCN